MNQRRTRTTARVALAALALLGAAALGACRGDISEERPRRFFPDLDKQPKYQAQNESLFFDDGRSQRPPAPGTVPFGKKPFVGEFAGVDFSDRAEFLRAGAEASRGRRYVTDGAGNFRLDDNGVPEFEYIERIPVEVTEDLVRLGKTHYEILCIACHGGSGRGDGTVGSRWAYALPTFHDPKYAAGGELGADGYLFNVIRHGVPNPGGAWPLRMPGYARKLTIEETWAIVAYIRALQRSQNAEPDVLPTPQRLELERTRAAAPAGGATRTADAGPTEDAL